MPPLENMVTKPRVSYKAALKVKNLPFLLFIFSFVFLSKVSVTEIIIRVTRNMRMYHHTTALHGSENDVND